MDTSPPVEHRDRIGPYSIVEPIGQGGMGVVYRAVRDGAEVAVKTVRVSNVEMLGGVRREILALARLDHPGVVRILDNGLDDGLPWYAMTLLAGVSLRDRFHRLRRPRRPAHSRRFDPDASPNAPAEDVLSEASPVDAGEVDAGLRILLRLCRTLAYVHGEGVVHLDLKPENVLVTDDDVPVLVDFGLAARFAGGRGRDTLDLGAYGSGTVAYMAPEQIAGGEVDARADLYAIGCMLFELLAGRRPFLGRGAVLAANHLGRPPVAPSSLAEGVDPALDALVLGLLAKEPADRIGYADDVAAALAQLGVDAEMPGPRPRPYVYRAGFAGREATRTSIDRDFARLGRGAGRIVLLGGESGVGKTRLASEIARSAREDDVLVLLGDCDPLGVASARAASPFNGLREPLRAIADRCREIGEHEVDRVFGGRAKVLADYEPALGALPGVERHPDAAPLDADAARLRVFAYLADVFAAVAARKPVLVVLDDVQWADELTLEFLQYLARGGRLESKPLGVLATYRDDEAGPEIAALGDAPDVSRVDLGRLDGREVSKIVGGMLALSPPPERLCHELHRASEGNPFFVTEYLRTAVEQGLLTRGDAGAWRVASGEAGAGIELAMPSSLRELVARRLDDLSAAASDVLRAAAVFGRSAPLRRLLLATRRSEPETLEAVTELVRRHAIRETRPGELEFTHDKIREAAYERIPDEDRAALHRAAAEALASEGADDVAGARAEHWELAGEFERASADYVAAARRARAAYANAEAERLYRAFLRLSAGAPEAPVIRNELGALLTRVGEVDEARREHDLALAASRASGDRRVEAESLLHVGVVDRDSGRREDAAAALTAALEIAREVGDRGLEGTILGQLGVAAFYGGSPERALAFGREGMEKHLEVGDRSAAAHQMLHLAHASWKLGRIPEAVALLDGASSRFRDLGDLAGEGRAVGALGTIRFDRGDQQEALRLYEIALARYREAGARASEGLVLMNMGSVIATVGDPEGALRRFDEALAVQREAGNRLQEGNTLSNQALLTQRMGRFDEARALFEASLATHRESGSAIFEANTIVNYGEHLFCLGRFEEAAERYATALALHRARGARLDEATALACVARLAAEVGRPEEADERFAESLALIREVGSPWMETKLLCAIADVHLEAKDEAVPSPEPIERALADARAQGTKQEEAQALRLLAAIARRSGGDLAEAASRAHQAEAIARQIVDPLVRIDCLCELARLAVARGLPASLYVETAAALVERLGLRPPAPQAARVERLAAEISGCGYASDPV